MGNFFDPSQAGVIDRDNRNMALGGIPMSQVLNDIKADISAGNIGIIADAGDVDSLALTGGTFSVDKVLTTGLTFALKAGRVRWAAAVVTSAPSTVTLSASTVNYVEVDSTGTVSSNTSGWTAGRVPLYIVTTGVSTISITTLAKALLTAIALASITGAFLSTVAATRSVQKDAASVAATTSIVVIVPVTGKLAAAAIANKTAITANDTDNWGFGLVNKSNASVAMLVSGGGANTTAATGGTALTAYGRLVLALTGTTANLNVTAGDVLELTVTKTGAPAALAELAAAFDFSFTT